MDITKIFTALLRVEPGTLKLRDNNAIHFTILKSILKALMGFFLLCLGDYRESHQGETSNN